ncbi:threonine-phosphate decarboxylase CobD [Aurantimonas sp. C2-6-R+9]|uniref:threonine-phosphate decarboxylase CobD n=1 Tax=unclassified Aurantimonas TaxID=2638230 RepID=UPI002E195126|nr:threonine-phosphate decarboxylase CobD [Aurantimonas sp. C2-6-R+9]
MRPDATTLRHGGALDAAIARHGGRREDWLDLSTGINPVAAELPDFPPEAFSRLPESSLERAALDAARRAYGAPADAGIVAAPGSQALISLLPFLLPPTEVAIVEPTYAEHRGAFAAAGHEVAGIDRSDDIIADTVTVAVVVNPNNPDGRVFSRAELFELHERMAARGGLLVVDEAFMDATPDMSLASEAGRPGLLIHRSFGKFFGLAGLRLGFALTTPDLAGRLSERLGSWAVSGPALVCAEALLGDGHAIRATRQRIRRQAEMLFEAVLNRRTPLVGRTALFATIRHERAGALFEALCRRRILTRPFAERPDWLRIGNPAGPDDAARLRAALTEALDEIGGEG